MYPTARPLISTGLGHLPADQHEFTFPARRQSRRADVRLHHRKLDDGDWTIARGILVTRPARIAADLLAEHEDPEAVGHVIADAIRAGLERPDTFAAALGPARCPLRAAPRRRRGAAELAARPDRRTRSAPRWIPARPQQRPGPAGSPAGPGGRPRAGDPMTAPGLYASPTAFRRGLTDRLRAAAEEGGWSLQQLQRRIAYDRLLERLYVADDSWVIKGATALLARRIGVRGTRDIDLFRDGDRESAERDLRDHAGQDIGDWFRFELAAGQPMLERARGLRIPVTAYIGTQWAEFHIDLLGPDIRMTARARRGAAAGAAGDAWRASSTGTALTRSSTMSPTRSRPSTSAMASCAGRLPATAIWSTWWPS